MPLLSRGLAITRGTPHTHFSHLQVEEIAVQIEDPFGSKANDLPLEAYTLAVQADVLARLAARVEEARRQAQHPTDGPPPIHPAVLAQALVGMWSRVLAWWAEDPERASAEVVIETLTQIQLNGTRPAQPGSIPI